MTLLSSGPLAVALFTVALNAQASGESGPADPASNMSAQIALKPVTTHLTTYVQAKQGPAATVRASHAGILNDLTVTPGSHVEKDDVIGHLGGPAFTSALEQARLALKSAQTSLKTEQSVVAVAQQRVKAHFGSRQEVNQANLAREDAQSRVDDASARLKALQAQQTLRAPVAGIVSATASVIGDALRDGDSVASIQPDGQLWLEGQIFGNNQQRLGPDQRGIFTPSDGSPPRPVSLVSRYPSEQGQTVRFGLADTDEQSQGDDALYVGETGKVEIQLAGSPQPAVPSDALILDQGRWWVMLDDGNGMHAQAVEPIARRDGWTWLRGKVHPGDRVRVSDAYLRFHQSFSTRYQQPD